MEAWWQGVVTALGKEGAALLDPAETVQALLRLLAAGAAGAVVGIQREHIGKSAGVRTHMLVSAGAALFIIASVAAGMSAEHVSRVIQGVAAGIGFIGGGVILKRTNKEEVHGLTTAAGIWMTAALGTAAGMGRYLSVVLGAVLAWFVLAVLRWFEIAEGERKSP